VIVLWGKSPRVCPLELGCMAVVGALECLLLLERREDLGSSWF
jgi:hypothetical protein